MLALSTKIAMEKTKVLNQLFQRFSSRRFLQIPALSLLLTAGFATIGVNPILASGLETSTPLVQHVTDSSKPVDIDEKALASSSTSLPDGVYLYGQSSEPEQIGREYIVFESSRGKVTGALYLPASEFSCFNGTLESKQLNLTLADSEDNKPFSYSIALKQVTQVAEAGGRMTAPNAVTLEGYQQLKQVSENDNRILTTCKADSHQ